MKNTGSNDRGNNVRFADPTERFGQLCTALA